MVKGVDVKKFFLCESYVTKIRQILDKNRQKCMILIRAGIDTDNSSQYDERIQESSKECTHDLDLEPMSLKQNIHTWTRQNVCDTTTQGKAVSHVTSDGQVAVVAKCSRQSQRVAELAQTRGRIGADHSW